MHALTHNAFPLRFGMKNWLAALWVVGHFFRDVYGKDSVRNSDF